MTTLRLGSRNLSGDSSEDEGLFRDIRRNLFDVHHTVLIVDSYSHQIPWESLPLFRQRSVSRMLSSQTLKEMLSRHLADRKQEDLQIQVDDVFYILNPDGDLKNTETEFVELFKS